MTSFKTTASRPVPQAREVSVPSETGGISRHDSREQDHAHGSVKIQGIILWPVPTNLKELRSFLGFCNFYRAFIKNFSKRARPLNDLTCKGCPFVWSQECEDAFNDLKDACSREPVLWTSDWNRQFIIQTDCYDPRTCRAPIFYFPRALFPY